MKDLAIAMKAASDKLMDRVLSSVSKETGEMLKEEMERVGPVRLLDAKDAQLRIKMAVRLLEEKRQIKVVRGELGGILA